MNAYGRGVRHYRSIPCRQLRRRSAIKAVICAMKTEGHLGRCYFKGREGDAANVLAAVAHNLRLVLAWLSSLLRFILGRLMMPKTRGLAMSGPRSTIAGCWLHLTLWLSSDKMWEIAGRKKASQGAWAPNIRHELVQLARKVGGDWIDHRIAPLYGDKGWPGIETRFVIWLFQLKYIYSLSDDGVCERWVCDPCLQPLAARRSFSTSPLMSAPT
jgi:hypothetical protein